MRKFLRHFFSPGSSNNYRPRILHPQILILFILFFFSLGLLMSFTRQNYPQVLGVSSDISIDQLLVLTNQQRQLNGLPPLSIDSNLDQAALNKGNYMFAKDFWAHIAPDGTTPWSFIKSSGYNYSFAGENLARGYYNAQDVVNAWMASPSHKENMLSKNYKDVGFAVLTGKLNGEDTVLVVEMLGSRELAVENNLVQNSPQQAVPNSSSSSVVNATTKEVVSNSNTSVKPLINAQTFSSNIAVITVTVFMFVLILDMIIIERKKILRFVGHNLDHVLFFILIGALILVILKGYVI
jgi:hypothetical protein